MAMIAAGNFVVKYDDDRKEYFVRETLEGRNEYCDTVDDVLAFIEAQIWTPDTE